MSDDRRFARRIGRKLEQQAIDAPTRAALRAARRRALDGGAAPARTGWVPAAALAILVLAVTAVLLPRDPAPGALPDLADDELAVIAADEALELLEEWEFYAWFDEQPDNSG